MAEFILQSAICLTIAILVHRFVDGWDYFAEPFSFELQGLRPIDEILRFRQICFGLLSLSLLLLALLTHHFFLAGSFPIVIILLTTLAAVYCHFTILSTLR